MTQHGIVSHLSEQTIPATTIPLTPQDYQLLNTFQHDLPLTPHPYAAMAEELGISEEAVIKRLQQLQQAGVISRVGVVLRPRQVGVSTLAAMRTPTDQLETIALLVNSFPEVNHNYEREHAFNLWFVITAANEQRLHTVITAIETQSGFKVHSMPMETDFHIDLGFSVSRS